MAEPAQTTVVIPAFNEQEAIADVVGRVRGRGAWREVLVVDDGSTDLTADRAAQAGARVVRHPYNKGNGAAVKTGIREAKGDVVLLMDADGQHDPEDMARLVAAVGLHDMVIGARAARDQSPTRALGNAIFRALASWLTGRPIPDLTSGFRAARRDLLVEILHLLPNGFSYPTTSCLALMKAGYNVTFVPVAAHPRVGTSKIRVVRDGVRFVLIILKIVTLYSPLKVFFPISAASFLLGLLYGVWNVAVHGKIPMGSALLIQLAVVVFLFGLISEQIAAGQDRA
ncbi:MAG TPA: glycosyltransferase family 2 protein [Vicinamibacteria bacterium]|nr:glycosyltransferase family 2 protein [Vicinamibacteria bacterium]